MYKIVTVFLKEILDSLRDRRTLLILFIAPFAVLTSILPVQMAASKKAESEMKAENYKVYIDRATHAVDIIKALRLSRQIDIIDNVEDPGKELKTGKIDLIINVPENFEELLQNQKPVEIGLQFESTSSGSQMAKYFVSKILNNLSMEIIQSRLELKGIPMESISPIVINEKDIVTKEQSNKFAFAALLLIFLVMFAGSGGITVATDLIAGEKEKCTLEPLLILPVKRRELIIGKFLATFLIAFLVVLVCFVSIVLAVGYIIPALPPEMFKTSQRIEPVFLTIKESGIILLYISLLTAFFSAFELVLSSIARNNRQAQGFMAPIAIISVIPVGMVMAFQTAGVPLYLLLIPIYNVIYVLREITIGDYVFSNMIVTAISMVVYTILGIGLSAKIFKKESILSRT